MNNLGQLFNSLDTIQKSTARKYEAVQLKLVKSKYSRIFNEICLRDELFPTFTNFKVAVYVEFSDFDWSEISSGSGYFNRIFFRIRIF